MGSEMCIRDSHAVERGEGRNHLEIDEDDTKEAKITPNKHELSPSQIIEEFEKSQFSPS